MTRNHSQTVLHSVQPPRHPTMTAGSLRRLCSVATAETTSSMPGPRLPVTQYLVDLHLPQHVFDGGPTFAPPMPREISNHLSVWPASGHSDSAYPLVAAVADQARVVDNLIGDRLAKDDGVVAIARPGVCDEDDPTVSSST